MAHSQGNLFVNAAYDATAFCPQDPEFVDAIDWCSGGVRVHAVIEVP